MELHFLLAGFIFRHASIDTEMYPLCQAAILTITCERRTIREFLLKRRGADGGNDTPEANAVPPRPITSGYGLVDFQRLLESGWKWINQEQQIVRGPCPICSGGTATIRLLADKPIGFCSAGCDKAALLKSLSAPGWSNGRTEAFGPSNVGSSPAPGANGNGKVKHPELGAWSLEVGLKMKEFLDEVPETDRADIAKGGVQVITGYLIKQAGELIEKHRRPLWPLPEAGEDALAEEMSKRALQGAKLFCEVCLPAVREPTDLILPPEPEMRPMSLGSLYDLVDEWDRQPWVWEGILPRASLSLIVGKSETGKSTLIYGLIYAIVRGQKFFGRRCEQGRVLYLAGDPVSEVVAGKTFKAMGLGPDEGVQVVAGALVGQTDGMRKLRGWVRDFRPTLVVGDTLAATVQIDVDKYGQSYQVQQPLTQIAREYFPNFLMAHHSQKSAIDTYSVIDAALGSVGVAAVASTRMATKMYTRQGKKYFTFAMSNLRLGQPLEGEYLVYKTEDGRIELGDLWNQRALNLDRELIVKVLERQDEPIAERTLWSEIFPKPKWAPFKTALLAMVEDSTVTCQLRHKKGGGKLYSLSVNRSFENKAN